MVWKNQLDYVSKITLIYTTHAIKKALKTFWSRTLNPVFNDIKYYIQTHEKVQDYLVRYPIRFLYFTFCVAVRNYASIRLQEGTLVHIKLRKNWYEEEYEKTHGMIISKIIIDVDLVSAKEPRFKVLAKNKVYTVEVFDIWPI